MKIFKILISGVVSTAFMTLYSYVKSCYHDKQFIEPQLLQGLLEFKGNFYSVKRSSIPIKGWIAHLAVGVFFTIVYNYLWQSQNKSPNKKQGFLLGTITGLIAVVVWKKTFDWHPNPPKIDYYHFYRQLIVAHMIFGIVVAISFKRLRMVSPDESA